MSSCKKWNSCNNKCKRNSGGRGGGGVNGVIGKDGATGPTGPTGPQGIPGTAVRTGATGPPGPTGAQGPVGPSPSAGLNAMIPYQPYNQNNGIPGAISLPSPQTSTFIQFIAPSTGFYKTATMLTNEQMTTMDLSGYNIKIRMAIYDNSGSYVPGPHVPTNHGIPHNVLGQGEIDISGSSSFQYKYINVDLSRNPSLIANQPYWFAYSTYALEPGGGSSPAIANIFDHGSLSNPGNDYSVLDISDNTTHGGGGSAVFQPITDAGGMAPDSKNRNNVWF